VKLIDRYNQFYNDACAGLPHGGPISMEELQSLALKSALYAFARKYNLKDVIPCDELKQLADMIEAQGNESNERHRTAMKAAQETAPDANDTL
jgi:hypothetical protein